MNSYLEAVIFFYIIKHPDLVKQFKGKFFSTTYFQELFDIIKPYIVEYKSEPPLNQVFDLIKLADKDDILTRDVVETIWQNRQGIDGYSEEWLFKNTKAFAEWNNFYRGIQRVVTYIKQMQSEVTYENCESILNKAKAIWGSEMAFNIGAEKGHDFFDVASHIISKDECTSSGYPFIDLCLDGGWTVGTLNCIMAAPKTGKTMWLGNLARKSVINGENTIFISLELAYQKIAQRIGAAMFEIPIVEYKQRSTDITYMNERMRNFYNTHITTKPGKFIIEQFPTGTATMDELESFILKKEEELSTPEKPFKFKNIFIDYANIMSSIAYGKTENMYLKVKSICEEMRASAIRNRWAIITATQINRSGFGSYNIDMENVSESAGLLATVDTLFGIIRSPLMKQAGVYYLKAVLTRDADMMGFKKKFNFNKTYLALEEDTMEHMLDDLADIPDEWKNEAAFTGGIKTSGKVNGNRQNQPYYNKQQQGQAQQAPQAQQPVKTVTAIQSENAVNADALFGNIQSQQAQQQAPQQQPKPNPYENYPKVDIGLTEAQLAGIPLGIF